ncbi:MAG: LysR family transcriptional regulator [Acidisphaera sp.]|nr:LysR family transcriptional regulator [Acidisphaera sp.]
MNTALARTFLEILESGSFLAAAHRLNITQSTVSMRVKALEQELGCKLFVRTRSRTEPTVAGQQFRPYAELFLSTWARARQEMVIATGVKAVLSIGAESSLWESFLIRWLSEFRRAQTQVAVRAQSGDSTSLAKELSASLLDVIVTYTPNARSGVVVEPLYDEKLVPVAGEKRGVQRWNTSYIYADWGPDIDEAHTRVYPNGRRPSLTGNIGALAIALILDGGGSGYFPLGAVREHLARGAMFVVSGAPVFDRRVYCVFPHLRKEESMLSGVIDGLRAWGHAMTELNTQIPDWT